MGAYEDKLADFSRVPVQLAIFKMDSCANTFGVAPCTASGEACYNTFPTCKDKAAYSRTTRDYKITTFGVPVPFKTGDVRPYLQNVRLLPTEIKNEFTIRGRTKIDVIDEKDEDVGTDPYVATRSSVQGTFWKKWLARNANWKGRIVETYDGFLGLAESDFKQTSVGKIENIQLGRGKVTVETIDLLKALDKIEVPAKVDIKLIAGIGTSDAIMTLSDTSGLGSTGYLLINEEIIYYGAKNDTTNQCSSLTRGALSTTPAAHSAKDKVQPCRYYAPVHGFDIMHDEMLLVDAGIDPAYIDSDVFAYWRDWTADDITFTALITEPTKLQDLFFEIVQILDASVWTAENCKITMCRNVPNDPSRTYHSITDTGHVVENSGKVDLNNSSRKTRVPFYWEKKALADIDKIDSYRHIDIVINADEESPNGSNEVVELPIKCRWITTAGLQEEIVERFVIDTAMRLCWLRKDARPLIDMEVEKKDAGILTGHFAMVTTDEVLEPDGRPITRRFQIVKREPNGNKYKLKVQREPAERILYIAPDDAPDYAEASETQRDAYGYICGDDGLMDNGDPGYIIY